MVGVQNRALFFSVRRNRRHRFPRHLRISNQRKIFTPSDHRPVVARPVVRLLAGPLGKRPASQTSRPGENAAHRCNTFRTSDDVRLSRCLSLSWSTRNPAPPCPGRTQSARPPPPPHRPKVPYASEGPPSKAGIMNRSPQPPDANRAAAPAAQPAASPPRALPFSSETPLQFIYHQAHIFCRRLSRQRGRQPTIDLLNPRRPRTTGGPSLSPASAPPSHRLTSGRTESPASTAWNLPGPPCAPTTSRPRRRGPAQPVAFPPPQEPHTPAPCLSNNPTPALPGPHTPPHPLPPPTRMRPDARPSPSATGPPPPLYSPHPANTATPPTARRPHPYRHTAQTARHRASPSSVAGGMLTRCGVETDPSSPTNAAHTENVNPSYSSQHTQHPPSAGATAGRCIHPSCALTRTAPPRFPPSKAAAQIENIPGLSVRHQAPTASSPAAACSPTAPSPSPTNPGAPPPGFRPGGIHHPVPFAPLDPHRGRRLLNKPHKGRMPQSPLSGVTASCVPISSRSQNRAKIRSSPRRYPCHTVHSPSAPSTAQGVKHSRPPVPLRQHPLHLTHCCLPSIRYRPTGLRPDPLRYRFEQKSRFSKLPPPRSGEHISKVDTPSNPPSFNPLEEPRVIDKPIRRRLRREPSPVLQAGS